MKLLLPMAYMFLIVLKNDLFVNCKPSNANENLKYRLMTFESDTENDGDVISSNELKSKFESSYDPQYIEPRIRPHNSLHENADSFVDEDRKNEKKNRDVPDEFEEEISHFKIPDRVPKRLERNRKGKKNSSVKKQKVKKRKPKKEMTVVEEDEDELNHQEEEEETEEKKEKIHKFTIKKKRPFKNTSYADSTSQDVQPYRTIIESNYGAGNAPHRLRAPILYKMRPRPLLLKENIEMLNPNFHFEHQVRKGIKPRDVNLILRTKTKNPRIFIRRYKPYISTFSYPFLEQRPSFGRGKRKKRRRKHKKRKKFHSPLEVETNFIPNNPYSASQVSCSNERPTSPMMASYPMLASASPGSDIDTTNHYESYFPYNYPSDYSSSADKFSIFSQPNEDYVNEPYDHYQYPAESFTTESLLNVGDYTTYYPDLNEHAVSKEEPLSLGYDVREHTNTEELASNHKQEMDDNLDRENENDGLQYEDGDGESADDNLENIEYENDRDATAEAEAENEEEEEEPEETNLRSDSIFEASNKKPIKKNDNDVD